MFKPFYCCFGLFSFWTFSFKDVQPGLFFYSNFQGFTYCSIFDFQGSLLLSVSAATHSVYQMLFCLSTTFLFIFSNFFEVRLSCFTRRVLTLSYLLVVVKQKFLFFYFRVKKIITWKWSGERGIWTLAPVARPTPLAGAPLRPLEYICTLPWKPAAVILKIKALCCFQACLSLPPPRWCITNYTYLGVRCQQLILPYFTIFFR